METVGFFPIPWIILILPIIFSMVTSCLFFAELRNNFGILLLVIIPKLIIVWIIISYCMSSTQIIDKYDVISFEKGNSDYVLIKNDLLINLNKQYGRNFKEGTKITIIKKQRSALGLAWNVTKPTVEFKIHE